MAEKRTSDLLEQEYAKLSNRYFVHLIRLGKDGEIESNTGFNPETYSLMKHGHPEAIDIAAREIFDFICANPDLYKLISEHEIAVTNSAREVPTASFTIMKRLVENYLNPFLSKTNGKQVIWVRSGRGGRLVESDYGTLSKEERVKRMAERKPYFSEDSKVALKGKRVILFDDLVATGTYEVSQSNLLMESGVAQTDIVRLYWVQIEPETAQNPEFEAAVNYAAIRDVNDLLGFFGHPDLVINERTLKYLMPKIDQLRSFFVQLHEMGGDITLLKIWKAGTTKDDYRHMERLRPGYDILEDYLKKIKII